MKHIGPCMHLSYLLGTAEGVELDPQTEGG